MKNYFEILEVDIHASKEIIDKAFKTLAKKYHPDTKQDNQKSLAEEQFKLLNEAYEILSDDTKREEYAKKLEYDKNSKINALLLKNADLEIQIENLQFELDNLKNDISSKNNENTQYNNENIYNNNIYRNSTPKQEQNISEYTYYESYYHPLKSKFKNILAFFITIVVIIFIAYVIWHIPYTHTLLVEMYNENSIIKAIVNFFI